MSNYYGYCRDLATSYYPNIYGDINIEIKKYLETLRQMYCYLSQAKITLMT